MDCTITSSTYQIATLTSSFYHDYPADEYPEILEKEDRPYDVILFKTSGDYFVCVPFRTYLNHKQGFHFFSKPLSTGENPGIDYSKMVIIKKNEYIGTNALIESKQMTCFLQNIATIKKEIFEYLHMYIHHVNGTKKLHPRKYQRMYQFTSLKYFHFELGI